MEVHGPAQTGATGEHGYVLGLAVKVQSHAALIEEADIGNAVRHGGTEGILGIFILSVGESDLNVVFRHFFVLEGHDIFDGIPQAESGQEQRRAAADAYQHHQKPLAIAEHVAKHDLVQKADVLPEGQVFQQNFFAGGWGLGPDQLCGDFLQSPAAAVPGDGQTHQNVNDRHGNAKSPVYHQRHGAGQVQNDGIGVPEDDWEQHTAQGNAQGAAQQRRRAGVKQIFADNFPVGVAQGFHGADLGPFFLYHSGHGGNAHQGSYQQEEHREHPGHALHDVRVAVQRQITHVGIPGQHIDFRGGHGVDGLPGIIQLRFGIVQLCLGFRQLAFAFCLAVFIFLLLFIQGSPGLLQGLLPFRQGFAFLVDGGLAAVQLGLTGFQLGLCSGKLGFHFRLLAVQFRKSGVDLVHSIGKLALSRFQFGFLSLHLDLLFLQFFQLGGIGLLLGFQLIQLGLIFRLFGFQIIQLLLQRCDGVGADAALDRLVQRCLSGLDTGVHDLHQCIQHLNAHVQLLQTRFQLADAGIQLGQPGIHLHQPGFYLPLILGNGLVIVIKGLGGLGDLGISFRFGFGQGLPGLAQGNGTVQQGVLPLTQGFLAGFQSHFVGFQGSLRLVQLGLGLRQLGFRLFFAVIIILQALLIRCKAVLVLLLGVVLDIFIPGLGNGGQQRLQNLRFSIHRIVKGFRVDSVVAGNGHMDFRVVVQIEALSGQVHIRGHRAIADGRGPSVHVHVKGRTDVAYHRKCLVLQRG